MSEMPGLVTRRTVGISDIPRVLFAPRQLFARVEDVPAWGWPLLILLTAVTLIGYATVETGLIDRETDRNVRLRMAEIDRTQRDVVERSALRDLYDQEYKQGEFEKLLRRMGVIIAEPAQALASALLIAALLYGVTALTGRKAEWHTLLTVCVFAGFIDLLRLLLILVLQLCYCTRDVDTSLALLLNLWPELVGRDVNARALAASFLSALDPFRLWFWAVVIIGLRASAQLPGWRAWLTCGLCWLVGAGGRGALATLSAAASSGAPPG